MPRYSTFDYGTGIYYGTSTTTTLSVSPFYALAIDYANIFLTWAIPTANYSRLRLVRNHYNIPESPEDGLVVFDTTNTPNGTIMRKIDGLAPGDIESKQVYFSTGIQEGEYLKGVTPLPSGRFIYYGIWVLAEDQEANLVWTLVSGLDILLAQDHATILGNTDDTPESPNANRTRTRSTHEKFMDLFPRVFTSETQSPLDEVQAGSDLYNFLAGITYTVDELMTYADLLLPDYTAGNYSSALLAAQAYDKRLNPDNRISTLYQRKLVREATYINTRKGTKAALSTLVESMTGFNARLIDSPNLMLSNQDSTFRKGIGSWKAYADCALYSRNFFSTITTSTEPYLIDNRYSGQVAIKTAGAWIANGIENPITHGIPVTAGTEYSWTYYQQKNSGAPTVKSYPEIHWFDIDGKLLKKDVDATGTAVTTSWAKKTSTHTAPVSAQAYVTQLVISSGTATLTVPSTAAFATNDTLTIRINVGLTSTSTIYGGLFTEATSTVVNGTTLTFTTTDADVTVGDGTTVVGSISRAAASFAGLKIKFDAAVTGSSSYSLTLLGEGYPDYYVLLDCMQFAKSTETSFQEARGIAIYIDPNKKNYALNPSFEDDTSNWTVVDTGASLTTVIPSGLASGIKSLYTDLSTTKTVSTTTDTGDIPLGRYCTFSVYMKADVDGPTVTLKITPIDDGSAQTSLANEAEVTLTTGWTRGQVTVFIPTTFTNQAVQCDIIGPSSEIGVHIDAAQIEDSYQATDYFDGSMATSGAEWTGADNASVSVQYYNKDDRLSRLYVELPNYLPNNTPYYVESSDGIEVVQGLRFASFSS